MNSFLSTVKKFLFPTNNSLEPLNDNTQNGGIDMKKVSIQVTGLVQGVGFRYMTKLTADQLGVFGIVRNEPDGSVYIEANGEPAIIDQFIEKIRNSPTPSGKVDSITIEELTSIPNRNKFTITN